jgi:hypothetical protein
MIRHRKTVTAFLLVPVIVAAFWFARGRDSAMNAERESRVLTLFQQSFNSSATQLVGEATVEGINRRWMPELGFGTVRPLEVNEYVVTAKFKRNGLVKWGRWLYTCNGNHGDGIFKYSYSEANLANALPSFPLPLQKFIPWTTQLIDGVPSTAGASATNVSVSSPVHVTDNLIVVASAPPGTVCRMQVFPPDALSSPVEPQQPTVDGSVKWTCRLNPRYAGSRLSLSIHCSEPLGTRMLENSTPAPIVEVLP